jgi:hypothetical protein
MASIKPAFGASFITRERNSRVMYVRMNVRGRDLGSAVRAVQKEMAAKVKIPEGYTVQWAGQYEFQQQANQHLMVIVPFTMAVIYLILLAAFASHRNAALIMCGVPLAALGGITALLLTGTYFSISAGVGFIALSGVAVQNGVILISHINHLRVEDELPVKEAAFRGAIDRSDLKRRRRAKSKTFCNRNHRRTNLRYSTHFSYPANALHHAAKSSEGQSTVIPTTTGTFSYAQLLTFPFRVATVPSFVRLLHRKCKQGNNYNRQTNRQERCQRGSDALPRF